MVKRILWVHSSSLETESYRDALTDKGYSVDNAGNAADALLLTDGRNYNAVCLSPYFLTLGEVDITICPVVDKFVLEDPLFVGIFLYKIIRKRQSDAPIFFVPFGLRKNRERLGRELGEVESKRIFDLKDVLPSELSEIVDRELRK